MVISISQCQSFSTILRMKVKEYGGRVKAPLKIDCSALFCSVPAWCIQISDEGRRTSHLSGIPVQSVVKIRKSCRSH